MDFSFLTNLLPKKNAKKEHFLALLFKPYKIGAILFEKVDGRLTILKTHEVEIDSAFDALSDEDLIEKVDVVVSTVESILPENALLKNTIFGLPYSFVEQGKIKKEYLIRFKKICEALELTPIGFIVDIEAIIYFLQKKDGAPITSIFVELTKHSVITYLVRAGNVIESHESQIVENYIHTVELLLAQVEQFEVLPTKIILLNINDAQIHQQKFLAHPWKKDLPFLHVPQVVTLEKGFEDEALIHGVAMQMGFDLLPNVPTKEKQHTESKEATSEVKEEDFGFVKDEDVAVVAEVPSEETQEEVTPATSATVPLHTENVKDQEEEAVEDVSVNSGSSTLFENAKVTGLKFLEGARSIQFASNMLPKKGILLGLIVLVGFLSLFVYSYYAFFLRAKVVVFVNQKVLDKTQDVVLSSKDVTDPEKGTIALQTVTVAQDTTVEKDTTGKKDTGEKATGTITIFNKTEDTKKFSKGALVVGPNSLTFELKDDVTIASTSAFSTNFSSAKVGVIAEEFGSEYNLPSQANFSVKGYSTSDFIAKNESAFSGGSKKTIAVVSKADLDNLESQALSNLKEKALAELKSKSATDKVTLPLIIAQEFTEKKFNKKEGEEAKKVSLTATISFTGGSYATADIEHIIAFLAKKQIPDSFVMQKDTIKTELKDTKLAEDKTVAAVLGIHTEFAPEISTEKITKQIAGKSVSNAHDVIKKIENVSDHTILFQNSVPFLPQILPWKENHIEVTIKKNA